MYGTTHLQLDTRSRAVTELLDKYFPLLANYLQALERAVMSAYLRVATNFMPSALVWNTLVRIYL